MKTTSLVTILTLLACSGSHLLFAEDKGTVDFAREVLPILSVSYTHLTLPTNREV